MNDTRRRIIAPAAGDILLGTKTTTADQITIKAHTAKFIHHHRQTLAAAGEQMAQHSGLTSPKEASDHGHRQTFWHGNLRATTQALTG